MAIDKQNIIADDSKTYVRYLIVGALVLAAFFGAYRFARASSADAQGSAGGNAVASTNGALGTSGGTTGAGGGGCGMSGGAGGGGCCGGGGSNEQVKGSTTVSGDVQKVTIDLTTGSYSPNRITAKAGIPLELDFKGPASGCNGYVVSQQLGFQQDVSNGGTIKVGALQPGNYQFSCSMGMYIAQIVVQ
jgi:hypothetical protein